MELIVGKEYLVHSARKGTFSGVLVTQDGDFATLTITGGRASAMNPDNVREAGDEVIIRTANSSFNPIEPGAPRPAAPESTPQERFGKDHWSLLAYVETTCVDGVGGVGEIDRRRLRCNPDKHPGFKASLTSTWRNEWSTRLAGFFEFDGKSDVEKAVAAGVLLRGHDDWDCLDDLEGAGLIEIISPVNGLVRLTTSGVELAAKLRAHKANGGQFASFKDSAH